VGQSPRAWSHEGEPTHGRSARTRRPAPGGLRRCLAALVAALALGAIAPSASDAVVVLAPGAPLPETDVRQSMRWSISTATASRISRARRASSLPRQRSPGGYSVFFGQADRTFTAGPTFRFPAERPTSVDAGDLDADGAPDRAPPDGPGRRLARRARRLTTVLRVRVTPARGAPATVRSPLALRRRG
jgi:hypothetical protein